MGGDDVRAVARLFVVLVVNRLNDVVRDVQSCQVKQFKGAEFEADLVAQDAVNRCEIGHALAHDAQGLGAIAATGVVDDEAGGVLRLNRCVAHLAGKLGQALANGRVGLEACDYFDHFHEGHRVEEVVARKLGGALQGGGNGGHGQRRGVGHQHGGGGQHFFQIGEQAFLDVELFDDGFDHQIAPSQVLQLGGAQQAAFVARYGFGRQAAFFLQLVPLLEHGITRLGDGFGLGVVEPDLAACLRSNLGNAASHGAGANDGDLLKCKGHVE